MSFVGRIAAGAGILALGLAAAPAALGRTTTSSNWAGYAVHRSDVAFEKVVGAWTEPTATCTPGERAFSSAWIGLGGYDLTSNALEQIGTEADCRAGGSMVASAWYELVPAPAHKIRIKIKAGDRIRASVTVVGTKARLQIRDLTRHRRFARTFTASTVDVSSAEWIVEAPSECVNSSVCQTLSLADFGTTTFSDARAVAADGRTGTISSRLWNRTRIKLATARHHFPGGPDVAPAPAARASRLSDHGTKFTITYAGSKSSGSPATSTVSSRPFVHIS